MSLLHIGTELRRFGRGKLPPIALSVVMLLPLLFGGLFVWSYWDPIGHLNNLPVALVNSDKGAMIKGKHTVAGDQIVDKLIESKAVDFYQVTPDDARHAIHRGAQGVGLCRTEHMFLGERKQFVQNLILASSDAEREAALAALLPLQKGDFIQMFETMNGKPMTVRLIDPPLHEFLPDLTELSVKVAVDRERGELDPADEELLAVVRKSHEANPMLGLRGVRLLLTMPGLIELQVRAIAEAAVERLKAGGDPHPEIMIPLIGSVRELQLARERVEHVLQEVSQASGYALDFPVGCMIELPRAAVTAAHVAEEADFFSFGTNDLTQTTWGFSRDDVEGSFVGRYIDDGIFGVSPFETIDADGVGGMVRLGVEGGRSTKPTMKMGVCGEHGGDPESIGFFHRVGLNYVSCSPFRVPVARLEAGRAAVADKAE